MVCRPDALFPTVQGPADVPRGFERTRAGLDTKEVTAAMENMTSNKTTATAAVFGVVGQPSAVRGGFAASLALLPIQKLRNTGDVRPVTAAFTADVHDVRTWSPPV
jgi:hypothetical protein